MRLQLLALLSLPLLSFASEEQQIPMNNDVNTDYTPLTHSKPTLADLLTIEPSVSIFYSYARELELSTIFEDSRIKSTLFVPTNKAVMSLARKPHQGATAPSDEGLEISEEEFDSRSRRNVERWVSAHIVPESPITLDSEQHPTLLHRKSISFTPISKNDGKGPEWSRVTLEDGVRIIGMKEGLNGVLYLIDGTVSYE
ncbi:hypothetical protein D9615_000925 [Tricholomella constricta]|uniref:FAS1 domain-containing protein n=1 Tax=Tricholomella constricta TaxID=117010 RepID=A0A8H5HK82_9AGAR|nr:hypothetical protein D9615_000925 [Tricholomella constricta]